MRQSILCIILALFSFGLMVHDASAGRFGGGRSFGVQRSHSSLFSSPYAQRSTQSMGQRNNARPWGHLLGGVLMGGLLASLFMGHGFGAGILSWLVLGSLAFFMIGFMRKRMHPGLQSGRSSPFQTARIFDSSPVNNTSSYQTNTNQSHPEGFDSEGFLRSAKVTFIRLQTAYDQKDVTDLMRFTTPEVFAEIKMQLNERNDQPNITEVVRLDAELLTVDKQVHDIMASVRFTGFIKENQAPMIALDEIWHFNLGKNRTEWLVSGIQQHNEGTPLN